MISRKVFLGMAAQAFITGVLTWVGRIETSVGQQLTAGLLLLVVAIVFGSDQCLEWFFYAQVNKGVSHVLLSCWSFGCCRTLFQLVWIT